MSGGAFPSEGWLDAARHRWEHPALGAARTALDARCEAYHRRLPAIPDRQAGYYHDYFCPEHAVELTARPDEPGRHVCPTDGREFRGAPYDDASLWGVNDELSRAALELAFRAVLAPDAANSTADRATSAGILLGYAGRYPDLHPSFPRPDGYDGIATFSALDESVWIIRLAWAFGLLGSALSEPERHTLVERLFDRASDHLWRVRWPEIHNVSVWNASALIALATVRGDEGALDRAVDGPLGLRDQLARGVSADGLWFEISLSYHYYTLAAAIWGVRTLLATGRSVDDGGAIRRMFLGPLALALPDQSLPAVNDCWYHIGLTGEVGHGIPDAAGFHEIGFGWTGDERLARLIRRRSDTRPRDTLEALFDGRLDIPADDASPRDLPIDHLGPSGLAVLRGRSQGPGDEIVAILKAGPGARDHGHPDQLAIQLYGGGARLLDDLGTAGYGIPLNEGWYRATASHNTIVVDGTSQPIVDGHLSQMLDEGAWSMAEGLVGWTDENPGDVDASARMRRRIVLADGYLIDLVDVECDRPRTIDWVVLPHGVRVTPTPIGRAAPGALGTGAGFEAMDDVRVLDRGSGRLRWRGPSGATLEVFLGPPDAGGAEQRLTATAPANPASDRLSVLVRRRVTDRTRFAAVLVPGRAGHRRSVTSVDWSVGEGSVDDPGLVSVTIHSGSSVTTWTIGRGAPRVSTGPDPVTVGGS